ncbi:MAG: TCR domain-containing protein [Candidatus Pacebacteria bacterium]|nr:TCR domain-containing protein [Candidatus Paceibacterota bacterium]
MNTYPDSTLAPPSPACSTAGLDPYPESLNPLPMIDNIDLPGSDSLPGNQVADIPMLPEEPMQDLVLLQGPFEHTPRKSTGACRGPDSEEPAWLLPGDSSLVSPAQRVPPLMIPSPSVRTAPMADQTVAPVAESDNGRSGRPEEVEKEVDQVFNKAETNESGSEYYAETEDSAREKRRQEGCGFRKPPLILSLSLGRFNSVCGEASAPSLTETVAKSKRPRKSSFNSEATEDGGQKSAVKCCNCKKSRCLKLYCECFAAGGFCQGCSCVDCLNRAEFARERAEAMSQIQYRNPDALKRRMSEAGESSAADGAAPVRCNCARSGCQKGYCECYKKGLMCGAHCGCTNCKNVPALRSLAIIDCGEQHQ